MSGPSSGGLESQAVQRHDYGFGIAVALQILSTILLALRLYSRFSRRSGRPGFDDAFLLFGWLFGTALTVFAILGFTKYGFDRHILDASPSVYSSAALIGWICELLFILSTSFNKISVLLLYERVISPFNDRKLLWTIRVTILFTVAYMIAFFILPFTTCKPFTARWEQFDPKHTEKFRCVQDEIAGPVSAGLNAASDLAAVIIPLVILSDLQKPLKQKLGLYSVFAIGLIVVGAGIARTVLITRLLTQTRDFTWIGGLVLLASLFEYHLALVCACTPSLRPLFRAFGPRVEQITTAVSSGRREKSGGSSRAESPISAQGPTQSPSFVEAHEAGLHQAGAVTTRQMSPAVAVAYEADDKSSQTNRVPRTPLLHDPDRALRLSGLSRFTRFSGFSGWSGLRTQGTSLLDVDEESVPDMPEVPVMLDLKEPDPALSPGYVACRGCGQYHSHGHTHNSAREDMRHSGNRAWWKGGKTRSIGRATRRESQSTFFIDDSSDT